LDLKTTNNYGQNIVAKLTSNITLLYDREKIKKCQSLLNFFIIEGQNNISEIRDAVWKEEPMVKAIRKHNLKFFCLLFFFGGKLSAADLIYLVNKIENENEKFAKETYFIKLLSKIRDQSDQTLLHHAAWKGKTKCLKILMDQKLNVDERNTDEEHASCFLACKNGETKCAETFIANNVSVNVYNVDRQTPLHFAILEGHQECLEFLIRKGGDVNAKDIDDWTPLHLAADYGKLDCLEVLLANGADFNARTNRQDTPLHIIGMSKEESKKEKDRCVEMLIKAGADVNAKDADDYSPLHIAALHGKVNCLEVLLANGADVNARNNEQKTPIHIIGISPKGSNAEKERCAEILINAGADVDAKDEQGSTPLHNAAYYGNVDSLEVLLANGADVNARTKKQNTPLHLIGYFPEVSKEEKERCAEMLINAGADIDAEDEDGDTIFYHSFFQTLREERPDLFTQN
jgi:ankyrin repeat protein